MFRDSYVCKRFLRIRLFFTFYISVYFTYPYFHAHGYVTLLFVLQFFSKSCISGSVLMWTMMTHLSPRKVGIQSLNEQQQQNERTPSRIKIKSSIFSQVLLTDQISSCSIVKYIWKFMLSRGSYFSVSLWVKKILVASNLIGSNTLISLQRAWVSKTQGSFSDFVLEKTCGITGAKLNKIEKTGHLLFLFFFFAFFLVGGFTLAIFI